MKNLLISLLACAISFGLTLFVLQSSAENISEVKETPATIDTSEEQEVETSEESVPATKESDNLEDISEENTFEDEGEEMIQEEEIQSEEPVQSEEKSLSENTAYKFNINPAEIEKDYKEWKKYYKENIELSYDFVPIDVNDTTIEKETFLEKLKTGKYIPMKVEGSKLSYKLYELNFEETKEKIGKSVKGKMRTVYSYFKKEGQPIPDFDFKDLNEVSYNNESLLGKIKIIKCWFIKCFVCVQEFPELNELYDKYESSDNIAFLSLAFDKPDELKTFLSKKEFRYPVVPNQRNFMTKELGVKQYPTHIIVDENNKILKMVNNVKALIVAVEKLADKGKIKQSSETEENYEENEETDDGELEGY